MNLRLWLEPGDATLGWLRIGERLPAQASAELRFEFLAHLDDDVIETLARYAVSHTSPLSDFKIGAMGGAIARVGETETACPHRDDTFARLRELKRESDPHNVFRVNHNIPPA